MDFFFDLSRMQFYNLYTITKSLHLEYNIGRLTITGIKHIEKKLKDFEIAWSYFNEPRVVKKAEHPEVETVVRKRDFLIK